MSEHMGLSLLLQVPEWGGSQMRRVEGETKEQ